jgi:hypothetical protein
VSGHAPSLNNEPDDEDAVRELLAIPTDGAIRLAFTREPSPSRARAVDGDRGRVVVVRDPRDGTLIGMGSRTVRQVWFAGRPARVGYLGQLRAARWAGPRTWRQAFGELFGARRDDELPFDLTVIGADNRAARQLLEAGLPGLPRYRPLATLETRVYGTRRRAPHAAQSSRFTVRRGGESDRDAVVALLDHHARKHALAPRWEGNDLADGGRCRDLAMGDFWLVEDAEGVHGCAAVWDQRAFKQVRVAGYHRWLGAARGLLNLGRLAIGRPALPRPGSDLRLAFLSHVACDAAAFPLLLAAATRDARRRGLDLLSSTLDVTSALALGTARSGPAQIYRSILYAVTPPGSQPESTDFPAGAPVHLEGATL